MQQDSERWRHLCELAAREQDPAKLMQLIKEINELLDAKERRLRGDSPGSRLSKGQHYSDFVSNVGTTTWGVRLSHTLNLQGHEVDHDSGAIQFVCSIR